MTSEILNLLLLVCQALNKNKVQYLVLGGTSVALHGYYRGFITPWGDVTEKPDLDFWYNPAYDNYFRSLNTLEDLGQEVNEFREEQTPNPKKSFFKYHFDRYTLDLLPQIKASISFRDAFLNQDYIEDEGTTIHFLSFNDLIKDKEATARAKDLADIEQLKISNVKTEDYSASPTLIFHHSLTAPSALLFSAH